MTSFSKLMISGWRQFDKVEVEFHPRLTILTGANGAGKSTIIRILAQHFGWSHPLLATPVLSKEGAIQYLAGLWDWFSGSSQKPTQHSVGAIQYSNGKESDLVVPSSGGITYSLNIPRIQSVQGLHIGSHRPSVAYQQVTAIPTNAVKAEQAYQSYYQETMQRYQNSYSQYSPTYRMKEAIISMATFGPGNQYVQRDSSVEELFENFKSVLSKVLPVSIGFRDISVRIPDVVVVTRTGEFVIDAASGGLMSLIDLAWQIFLYSHDKSEFVVAIDEPENHLHPSMQRTLLRQLIDAFPNGQFVVATHSPFIVSSVKDSHVYVLRYDEGSEASNQRRISSVRLDRANKAGTASEILRDVLGVPVTLPEWAEADIKAIADKFAIDQITPQVINDIRMELDARGLGDFYPDTLKRIADQK